jgi:ectoine hydroxylase-related dioxygenase (phytanoyl-CoA dioxygenase family)
LLDFDAIIKEIDSKGYSLIRNFIPKIRCLETIDKLELILNFRQEKLEFIGNNDNQVLYNYFIEKPDLLDFVYNNSIFKLMSQLLDADHVLTSTSARNKRLIKVIDESKKTSGIGWHTDARYIFQNKIPIKPSVSYIVIFLLENFTQDNGATQYVPFSHKYNFRPERNGKYEADFFSGIQGDVIVMDTALFHKAGLSTSKSRWAIFSMYSSWFIKPYFQFNKMFSQKEFNTFDPRLRQLLHCDSIPPLDHKTNRATLKRIQKLE